MAEEKRMREPALESSGGEEIKPFENIKREDSTGCYDFPGNRMRTD